MDQKDEQRLNTGSGNTTIQIRLSRKVFVTLLLAMLLPWGVVAYLTIRGSVSQLEHAVGGMTPAVSHHEFVKGPWGLLDLEPFVLDYPSSHAIFDFDLEPYRQWTFRDCTLDQLRQKFASAGLSAANSETLLKAAIAAPEIKGFVIHPPDALVRSFSPAVRAAVYSDLSHDVANVPQVRPFMFRGATLEEWFAGSGVSTAMLDQIRPLIYRRENYLMFSDPQLVVPSIESRIERIRLYRTLRRTATWRARVHLIEGTTPDAVLEYWGRPNRSSEIEPILSSLITRQEGIGILVLLPPFARSRLYSYPDARQHDELKHDCHWSALNFFNNPADDRMVDGIAAILTKEYDPISGPTQLGDVVLMFVGDRLVHSCVYIAGDMVFTKNGIGVGDPFVLEKLDDVTRCYRGIYGPIRLAFCRRKGM